MTIIGRSQLRYTEGRRHLTIVGEGLVNSGFATDRVVADSWDDGRPWTRSQLVERIRLAFESQGQEFTIW